MVSALQSEPSEDKLSWSSDGGLRRFSEVHPGATELWDVVGEVSDVLLLQGGGVSGMLELHEKNITFRLSLSLTSLVDIFESLFWSVNCCLRPKTALISRIS